MELTSASLLERLRHQADPADWQRLTAIYRPWLVSWLRRHGMGDADAEDLVQDILVVVLHELPFFQHNRKAGAFRAWLRTIAVNRLRDALRARSYRPTATGDSAFLDQLEQLEDPTSVLSKVWELEHDRHIIGRLLAMIEPDFQPVTWQAFRGVMLDGQSPRETAARLGISVNAVLLAKSRILARLRQEARGLIEGD
jgi:RNA polymerase sigma-70 factor (ECF subfamily)